MDLVHGLYLLTKPISSICLPAKQVEVRVEKRERLEEGPVHMRLIQQYVAKIVPRSKAIIIVVPLEVILEFSEERFIIIGTHFTEIF